MRFLDLLDQYLMSTATEDYERRSHHASDANACVRQLVYKWRKVPMSDPPTPGDVLKWRMGDAAEKIAYDALAWAKERGLIADFDVQVRKEVEIEGLKYPIVCKLDAVVYPVQGEQAVGEGLEVKSMFGRGIINIQKSRKPKPDHLVQVLFYLNYGERPRHTLVYVGRDFGYRTEFECDWRDHILTVDGDVYEMPEMEYFIERFRRIERYLDSEEAPPRDFLVAIKDGEIKERYVRQGVEHKSDWQCMYCAWRTRCWTPVVKMYQHGSNWKDFAARAEGEGGSADA